MDEKLTKLLLAVLAGGVAMPLTAAIARAIGISGDKPSSYFAPGAIGVGMGAAVVALCEGKWAVAGYGMIGASGTLLYMGHEAEARAIVKKPDAYQAVAGGKISPEKPSQPAIHYVEPDLFRDPRGSLWYVYPDGTKKLVTKSAAL